jgi:putative ABC transport system substrate-binding protein
MQSYQLKRREFITLLGGTAAAWPLIARAQQSERVRRVGVLVNIAESDPQAPARLAAIRNGLRERGWSDSLQLDVRFSPADADGLRALAAELLALKPDVIFAGNTSSLGAVHRETRTVPVVFAQVEDPVANGFIASLARPGGNITGFTNFEDAMPAKWLEMLKELAPGIVRIGFLYDPTNPAGLRNLKTIEAAGSLLGVEVSGTAVDSVAAIDSAIASIAAGRAAGLVVLGGATTATHRDRIIALAELYRLPAIYPYRYFVASGGLASYGTDTIDLYRRAMSYVDRILRGEKPAELPVQQPTRFEFLVNLKAAKAIGLEVPPTLLSRADEVIE